MVPYELPVGVLVTRQCTRARARMCGAPARARNVPPAATRVILYQGVPNDTPAVGYNIP